MSWLSSTYYGQMGRTMVSHTGILEMEESKS